MVLIVSLSINSIKYVFALGVKRWSGSGKADVDGSGDRLKLRLKQNGGDSGLVSRGLGGSEGFFGPLLIALL